MPATKCHDCTSPATHQYAGKPVCVPHYKERASADERPNSIPANHDWEPELNRNEL